ncbi:MAG: 5-formaminoimidazole-4-carboxamide-1-beta-D-ribofuranosyl 5'-monophosphate synthetase [Flavobacteriales bacterium]|jgi:hypothetical protein
MISKTTLAKAISDFPEEFTLDELIERLVLITKVSKAEQDVAKGNLISESELEYEMKKWFK